MRHSSSERAERIVNRRRFTTDIVLASDEPGAAFRAASRRRAHVVAARWAEADAAGIAALAATLNEPEYRWGRAEERDGGVRDDDRAAPRVDPRAAAASGFEGGAGFGVGAEAEEPGRVVIVGPGVLRVGERADVKGVIGRELGEGLDRRLPHQFFRRKLWLRDLRRHV